MASTLSDIASGKANAPTHDSLRQGLMLVQQNKNTEALPYLEQALQEKESSQILLLLAEIYMFQGNNEKAGEYYKRAYELEPQNPQILFHLIEFDFYKAEGKDDPVLNTLEQLEAHIEQFPLENQAQIYYTLAKLWRSLKDYDRDFEYTTKGAEIKKQIAPFNPEAHGPYFQAIASYFTPEFYEKYKNCGAESDLPVFITGMPRSGTTLIEQILHSHKDITGIGEDTVFMQLLTQKSYLPPLEGSEEIVYPYRLEPAENEPVLSPQEIGKEYISYLLSKAPHSKRVANKAISSFIWLGMVPVTMPNAKIIICERDSMDTCVSAYLHNFTHDMQPYTNDLEVLGDYYRCAHELMEYWQTVMPDNILKIQYEDLVSDQETWTRKMIEFLGLEWDPACLEFYKTQKTVRTASTQQVRKPLYNTAVGKWKNYEKHLAPLKKALQKNKS